MTPRRSSWKDRKPPDPAGGSALSQALDLARTPRLGPHLRRQPLPPDVLTVIRLAAGCRDARAAAEAATGRTADDLLAAADLYLRQVVCFPGADPHRVLGVPPGSARALTRRNMRELVLWLHPDRGAPGWNTVLLQRVLEAWRLVDRPGPARAAPGTSRRARRGGTFRPAWIPRPLPPRPGQPAGPRGILAVLRLALIVASLVVPSLAALCPSPASLTRLPDGRTVAHG